MFDPGKLRHIVTFQQFNGARDDYGDLRDDLDENWEVFKTIRASIDPLSGKEFYAAEQSQSEVTHKIRCRYFEGAKSAMRIIWKNRKFHVVSVIDWEMRHESYLIMVKELTE